jgi:hypothetical protein
MVRVVYMREATVSSGVCDAAPATLSLESAGEHEWMDLEANHDIRFELTDSNESLLESRATPRFGGWPDGMQAATSAHTDATSKSPQPAIKTAALPVNRGAPAVRGAESASAVAVAAAGEQSSTAQDTADWAGQTHDYRQDQEDFDDPVSDTDLDLDFLVDELSAFEAEMTAAKAARAPPARASASASASASGAAAAFVDFVDLT